ncbi:MAG: T9SS type A sorting domain-containing protein [Chitinophagales bacterium]
MTKTCIGGNKDEVIYPKYFDRKNSDYNFKCNDGSSIYFFYSNSTDGDFAPNKGYNDLVVLKINTNGQIDFTKNIGNSFYEKSFIVKSSADSSLFFILLERHSNDSLYEQYFNGIINIQHTLMCIDKDGNIIWNKLLRSRNYNKNDSQYFPGAHWENQINLFTDNDDNCLTFFEDAGFDTIAHQYIIDSIFYTKTDKNGNIIWKNSTKPFSIYNNSFPNLQIDTFFNYSFRTDNNFAETNSKYILSAYLSNNRKSGMAIYNLDKNTGNIYTIFVDSFLFFKLTKSKNEFIIYGNLNKFVEDSGSVYSYFHYRKYDEALNKIYENELRYNIPFEYDYGWPASFSKTTYCNPVPYFNNDSSKIWFSTDVNTVSEYIYYYPLGYNVETKTYAYILDPANGVIMQTVDLNKRKYNSLLKKINDVFYYYSFDTTSTFDTISFTTISSIDSINITAYNFDGTELRSIDDSVGIDNDFLNSICNIENSIVVYNNSNSRLEFKVMDTLLNTVMQGLVDTASSSTGYFYNLTSKYNIHILDTNHYCVLQSIWQDTISGCYPNTDNIIFNSYTKNDIISSVKNKTTSDFLSIYPNPNNGNFSVNFSSNGNYPITISLFDVTGKIVYQQSLQHNEKSLIPISDAVLANGLYNIQISGANEVWNRKVLITK